MAFALAAVLGGSFSRFGYSARMGALAGAALVVRSVGFAVEAAAGSNPALNVLQYVVPVGAAIAACWVVFANRPRPAQPALRPVAAFGSTA